MDYSCDWTEQDDGVHVTVAGEVDADTAPAMLAALGAAIERDPRLAVDLSAVTFMDSQGLSALLSAVRQAERRGGTLRLDRVSPRVLKLFRLTRLDSVLLAARGVRGRLPELTPARPVTHPHRPVSPRAGGRAAVTRGRHGYGRRGKGSRSVRTARAPGTGTTRCSSSSRSSGGWSPPGSATRTSSTTWSRRRWPG